MDAKTLMDDGKMMADDGAHLMSPVSGQFSQKRHDESSDQNEFNCW